MAEPAADEWGDRSLPVRDNRIISCRFWFYRLSGSLGMSYDNDAQCGSAPASSPEKADHSDSNSLECQPHSYSGQPYCRIRALLGLACGLVLAGVSWHLIGASLRRRSVRGMTEWGARYQDSGAHTRMYGQLSLGS